MNTLLFYLLIALVVYLFFFNNNHETFKNNNELNTHSKKTCSQTSINDGIFDYVMSGHYDYINN